MKPDEQYLDILDKTISVIEENFPNWKMVNRKNFASLFSRCLPNDLTYEDICVVNFFFHLRPEKVQPKEDRLPLKEEIIEQNQKNK